MLDSLEMYKWVSLEQQNSNAQHYLYTAGPDLTTAGAPGLQCAVGPQHPPPPPDHSHSLLSVYLLNTDLLKCTILAQNKLKQ